MEGRATVGNGCRGYATGDIRGGLADGDVIGRGCGITDGGGASTDLADGARGSGWDYFVGEGCLGRDSDASSRALGGVVGASCSGCSGGCGGVGGLPLRVSC